MFRYYIPWIGHIELMSDAEDPGKYRIFKCRHLPTKARISICLPAPLINSIDTKSRPLHNTEKWQIKSSATCCKYTQAGCKS